MALETLKDVSEIGGTEIYQTESGGVSNRTSAVDCDIHVYHDEGKIMFQVQRGPIKEVGQNGCQVDALIHVARHIIAGLNKKFPCRENSCAITKLDEAIMWLDKRTADRKSRGVEGTNTE